MRIRTARVEDCAAIEDMSAPDGNEYKYLLPPLDSPLMEEAIVIENEAGEMIASAFAIRTPEVVLVMKNGAHHPSVKLRAIDCIHAELRERLQAKGYSRAFAVVPPMLKGYIRHMKKKFGWKQDYTAYRIE